MADRTWMTFAACRTAVDPEIFYPTAGLPTAEAKAICESCPVRQACSDYADAHHEHHGVWGGTQRTRNRVRNRMTEASR